MSQNTPKNVKIENFGQDAVCESCGSLNATRVMFSKDSSGGVIAELCPVCLSAVLDGLSSDDTDQTSTIGGMGAVSSTYFDE